MGKNYTKLSDEELDQERLKVWGNVLRPVSEIGREAVIRELVWYDRYCLKEGLIDHYYDGQGRLMVACKRGAKARSKKRLYNYKGGDAISPDTKKE